MRVLARLLLFVLVLGTSGAMPLLAHAASVASDCEDDDCAEDGACSAACHCPCCPVRTVAPGSQPIDGPEDLVRGEPLAATAGGAQRGASREVFHPPSL